MNDSRRRSPWSALAALTLILCASTDGAGAEELRLERLFPTAEHPVEVFGRGMIASPVVTEARGEPVVIVVPRDRVVAIDPTTGATRWAIGMPRPVDHNAEAIATPVEMGNLLVVVYQPYDVRRDYLPHRAMVIDLTTGTRDKSYPFVEFAATVPAAVGDGIVRFNPSTQTSRAALIAAPPAAGRIVYVSFGSRGDIQPWHGWMFELDLDAWQGDGPEAAITAVLVTTPEAKCPIEGDSGARDMICGGGVWAHAGPQLYPTDDGFELIVPTGNGQLDLARGDYAQSVLRTGPSLTFEPGCDRRLCEPFDPRDPSPACLESCRNLFVPRLMPGDPPLRPASGVCEGMTLLECLAELDYDLGASSPARVELDDGRAVLVQPGKEGGLYLFDAEHLGRQYDREQVVSLCGTPVDECKGEWRGMIISQPVVTRVDDRPTVLIPTFAFDESNPAGLVALQIVTDDGEPRFERLWEAPDFDSPEAIARFRYHPTRAALWTAPDGETYALVVDIAAGRPEADLLAIRVRDGAIVAQAPLAATGQPHLRPAIADDVVYIPSNVPKGGSMLEAYRIVPGG